MNDFTTCDDMLVSEHEHEDVTHGQEGNTTMMDLSRKQRVALGDLLRSLATREQLTQDMLAEALEIDRATISKVWRGEVKKAAHYQSQAEYFGLTLDEACAHAIKLAGILDRVSPKSTEASDEHEAFDEDQEEENLEWFPLTRSGLFGEQALVLAVASQKGGTGKTTCAVNLANEMASLGHAVLLIDLDPQGDATLHVGAQIYAEHYVDAVRTLKREGLEAQPGLDLAIWRTPFGFDLMPSGEELEEAAERISSFAVSSTVLRKLLVDLLPQYDFIFIDCQPTLGVLQKNAIVAATHLLFPVQLHQAAINGLDRMMSTVDELRELNPMCRVLASIPCFDENTVLAREMMRELRERYYARPTAQSIPKNIAIAEAYAAQEPVSIYQSQSAGARAFASLCEELLVRLHKVELGVDPTSDEEEVSA